MHWSLPVKLVLVQVLVLVPLRVLVKVLGAPSSVAAEKVKKSGVRSTTSTSSTTGTGSVVQLVTLILAPKSQGQ